MNLAEHFNAALIFNAGLHPQQELATALATSAAQVLPVDAAGISLFGGRRRVPLGASTPAAAAAEQWQYTLGEGPCLSAYERGEPVVADEATFLRSWSGLYAELRRHGPYRAVIALPLGSGQGALGAVDLYFTTAAPAADFDLPAAQTVALLIHAALLQASTPRPPVDGQSTPVGDPARSPAWLDSTSARTRHNVRVAIGMCIAGLAISADEAAALLRARAYADDLTMDELAADIADGTTPVGHLRDPHHP